MSQAKQTTDQWHYAINGQQHGPISWTELQKLSTEGKLARSDRVWRQGYAEWVLAEQVEGLFATDSSIGVMKRLFARFKAAAVTANPDSATFQNFADSASRQVKSKSTWLWSVFVAILMFFRVFAIIAVGVVFGIGIADLLGLLKVAIGWLHASYPDFSYQTAADFARNWIANSHDKNWLLVDSVAVAVLIIFFGFLFVCFRRRPRVSSYIGVALFSLVAVATLYHFHVIHWSENPNNSTPTTYSDNTNSSHPAKVQDNDEKRTADFFMNYPANVKSPDFMGKKLVVEGEWNTTGRVDSGQYRINLSISPETSPGGYESLGAIADFSLKNATGSILCLGNRVSPPQGQRFKVKGTYTGLIDISGGIGMPLEKVHLTDCEVQDAEGQVLRGAAAADYNASRPAVSPPPSKVDPANLTKKQFIDKMKQIMSYGSVINNSAAHAIFMNNSFQRTFGDPDSNVEWENNSRLFEYQCLDGSIQLTVHIVEPIGEVVVEGINQY